MSVGERLITLRISAVAVCRSSASVSSRLRASSSVNNRTFSIAITAWSAKVWSREISFRRERTGLTFDDREQANDRVVSHERNMDERAIPGRQSHLTREGADARIIEDV